MVPLKYLSNVCVIIYTNVASQGATFEITDRNLYVPVVNLSTQDNVKLLAQLKSGLKRQLVGINIYGNQNY